MIEIDQHKKLRDLAKEVIGKEEVLPSYQVVVRLSEKKKISYSRALKGLAMMIEFGAVTEPLPGYFQLSQHENG